MIRIIRHDLFFGTMKYWKRYLIFAVFILICNWQCLNLAHRLNVEPSFWDYMFNIYHGFDIFVPSDFEIFQFPLIFCLRGILLAVIIGDYSLEALKTYSHNIIIKSGSRVKWALSKIIRNCAAVIICHLLTIILCLIFTSSVNGYNIKLWQYISKTDYIVTLDNSSLFILFFVMPFLFSLWISQLQELISYFSLAASAAVILVYQFVSAYYFSPFLLGNYAMIQRYDAFIPDGLNPYNGLLYMVLSLIMFYAAEIHIVVKADILGKMPS